MPRIMHRVYGPALPEAADVLLIGIGKRWDGRRRRSGQPRGSSSLHAGCDAAMFGVHFWTCR